MQISETGLTLIKTSEGFRDRTYTDLAGNATIGYGHKLLPGESYPEGITEPDAEDLIRHDLVIPQQQMIQLVPASCTQNQWDALCSFAYNLGILALRTMLGHGWDQVRVQLPLWNHVKGVVVDGLTKRRAAELKLFLT
jgi:lysozyme